MTDPLGAGIAFFALGATFMSCVLLLLFNPRSVGLRWYAVFWVCIMAWLGAQGFALSTGSWGAARPVFGTALHLAPGFFLAFAVSEGLRRPFRQAVLPVLLALALWPLHWMGVGSRAAQAVLAAWNIVPWIVATAVMWGPGIRQTQRHAMRRGGRWVVTLLFLALPVSIVASLFGPDGFGVYGMPLVVVWIQVFVFAGVVYLRFYDIEVRAGRTGEIAARAAEGERLAVLGELTASLAHEVRNPLTGVRSLAQRLAEEEIDEPRRRRYAGVILEEVGRVERLVANLLEVARRAPRTAQPPAQTRLGPLFDDLLLLVGSRAEKAGVRLAADGAGLVARAPRETLAQLLLNLLLNAVAHTPRGGTVSVLARGREGSAEVVVRDTGPGVPEAERERIWDAFYSGTGSTGLGLAVVRRLAREEGWAVEVGDAPGGGAEFRLRIPVAPGADEPRGTQPMEAVGG